MLCLDEPTSGLDPLMAAVFRECALSRARLVGVVMQDAEIDGLVTNLVVNGVEVMSYVEAELDRRHPVRLLIRADEPADLREAWRQLRDDWATTAERVRSMPAGSEHRGVDGEWSMVETLRHLVFVHGRPTRRVAGQIGFFRCGPRNWAGPVWFVVAGNRVRRREDQLVAEGLLAAAT